MILSHLSRVSCNVPDVVVFGFYSGMDGLMNIMWSFLASKPLIIVAKIRKAWSHGEHLLQKNLMCSASMNPVGPLYIHFIYYQVTNVNVYI